MCDVNSAVKHCKTLYSGGVYMNSLTNKKIFPYKLTIFLFAILFLLIMTGCDAFNPAAPRIAAAKIECDFLRAAYKSELSFKIKVAQDKDNFIRYFCKKSGFHIPKDGDNVEPPTPLPKLMAKVTNGKKVDRCRLRGLTKEQCDCIKSGKSKHECQHPHKKYESEK
jgi:hypothetical protein